MTQETECFLESRRFKGGKSEKTKPSLFLRKYSFFLTPLRGRFGVWGIETPELLLLLVTKEAGNLPKVVSADTVCSLDMNSYHSYTYPCHSYIKI